MALLLLRNEAACLVPDMKTELVSSRVPPELSRSPLPRERFRPPASSGQSTGEGVGHSKVRCTQLSDVQSMILFVGSIAAIDALALAWRKTAVSRARTLA